MLDKNVASAAMAFFFARDREKNVSLRGEHRKCQNV
jgi:hypothetical protein